jgi:hypothetical protein
MDANGQGTGQGTTTAGESQGAGNAGNGAGQGATQGAPGTGDQGQQGTPGSQGSQPQSTPLEGYEFQAPEGAELDKAALDGFLPIAKELGLSAEAAQKLVNYQATLVQQQAQGYVAQQAKWAEDAKVDPDFGGAKFDESLRQAQAVVEFIGPEFKEFLNASGMGNHPQMFRALAKLGPKFAADKVVSGESRNPGGGAKTEEAFFPSMKK